MYDNKGSMRKSIFRSNFLLYSACHSSDLPLNAHGSSCAIYSSVEMSFLTSRESRFSSYCDMVTNTHLAVQSVSRYVSTYCDPRTATGHSSNFIDLFSPRKTLDVPFMSPGNQILWGIWGSHNLICIRPMTKSLVRDCTKRRREMRHRSPN